MFRFLNSWTARKPTIKVFVCMMRNRSLILLRRTQELEKQKVMLTGVVLIVMGVAFQSLSHTLGGSDVKDFFSGLLLGLSVAEMLAGIAVICKGAKRK